MNKVKTQTEKYPIKRGYAIGKLQKFLKLSNLTKRFRNNCIKQETGKGHESIINGFRWINSNEAFVFWEQVSKDFIAYCNGEKVFNTYED